MQVYWKNLKSVKEKVTTFILWTFAVREVFPLLLLVPLSTTCQGLILVFYLNSVQPHRSSDGAYERSRFHYR